MFPFLSLFLVSVYYRDRIFVKLQPGIKRRFAAFPIIEVWKAPIAPSALWVKLQKKGGFD